MVTLLRDERVSALFLAAVEAAEEAILNSLFRAESDGRPGRTRRRGPPHRKTHRPYNREREMRKTIGVLGGMGPEATAHFFSLIIRHTAAAKDQDHVPVLIYNLPQIPERTPAILGRGPSPVPLLRKGVLTLARAGADFIVIPCVSAHAFLADVRRSSPVPILSLVEEALAGAKKMNPSAETRGSSGLDGNRSIRAVRQAFRHGRHRNHHADGERTGQGHGRGLRHKEASRPGSPRAARESSSWTSPAGSSGEEPRPSSPAAPRSLSFSGTRISQSRSSSRCGSPPGPSIARAGFRAQAVGTRGSAVPDAVS